VCKKFCAASVGEISQHLAKFEAKYSGTFFPDAVYMAATHAGRPTSGHTRATVTSHRDATWTANRTTEETGEMTGGLARRVRSTTSRQPVKHSQCRHPTVAHVVSPSPSLSVCPS